MPTIWLLVEVEVEAVGNHVREIVLSARIVAEEALVWVTQVWAVRPLYLLLVRLVRW